ncbi:MAG: Hint domain-containing protein [Candidatus Thermoplasmatota archaeon]
MRYMKNYLLKTLVLVVTLCVVFTAVNFLLTENNSKTKIAEDSDVYAEKLCKKIFNTLVYSQGSNISGCSEWYKDDNIVENIETLGLSVDKNKLYNETASEDTQSFGCLPGDTEITMADGTLKKIEEVEKNDEVLSFNIGTRRMMFSSVKDVKKVLCRGLYEINDGLLYVTEDHPLFVKHPDGGIGLASFNPVKTFQIYGCCDVSLLSEDDEIYRWGVGWTDIENVVFHADEKKVYTLCLEGFPHNFFANSVLVSNSNTYIVKSFKEGVSRLMKQNYVILSLQKIQSIAEDLSYDEIKEKLGIPFKYDFKITIVYHTNTGSKFYTVSSSHGSVYDHDVSAVDRKNVLVWDSENEGYSYGWIRVEIFA